MMAPKERLLRSLLPIIASLCVLVQAQTSMLGAFQYGPVPASLEASVVTSYVHSESGAGETIVATFTAACASAKSPENDACRALSIYPVELYHDQGSVWGGVMTARAEKRTTTWACALGDCSSCRARIDASCTLTIAESGSTVTTTRYLSDGCSVMAGFVPLVITGGVEKLEPFSYSGMPTDAAEYLSIHSSQLSVWSCPARTVLGANTASATTTLSKTGTSAPSSITGQASVAGTPTSTGAVPTSSKAAASRHVGGPVWILACLSSILLQAHWL